MWGMLRAIVFEGGETRIPRLARNDKRYSTADLLLLIAKQIPRSGTT